MTKDQEARIQRRIALYHHALKCTRCYVKAKRSFSAQTESEARDWRREIESCPSNSRSEHVAL